MSSYLHPISSTGNLFQFAKQRVPSTDLFYDPITGRIIAHQETQDLALHVHPVLFRRKHVQEKSSAMLLTKFERSTFLDPTRRFYQRNPELIAQLIDGMDCRFGSSRELHNPRDVNDYFQNLVRAILNSHIRRKNKLQPLVPIGLLTGQGSK